MRNKISILFAMTIFLLVSAVAYADPPSPCGYTCGSNACTEVSSPPGCQATCPNPPGSCVVCTNTCQGNCVPNDPSKTYYSACFNAATFDWNHAQNFGDIPPNVIAQNFEKLGNRISDLSDAQKAAFMDALIARTGLPPGSIDLSKCTGTLSCGITVDANGNIELNSGGVPLMLNNIHFSKGSFVEAISPQGWRFTIPPDGEISIAGVIIRSTGTGTVTWDGQKVTLGQGTSLTYTDAVKGTITTVFSKEGNTDVYFGVDLPPGKSGVAINGPSANGDGVQIRGVHVAVAHTTKDGQTIGIITDYMIGTQNEVLLKKVPNQNNKVTYALDLTMSGNSNVKFTDAYEGLTNAAGTIFQCTQPTGSCPFDPKTDITLIVTWNKGGPTCQNTPLPPECVGTITILGQSGIAGGNIMECPCDKTVPCDAGCVCDMICGLCDPIARPNQACLPEWMYITFGYGNYLKCTKPSSSIKCNDNSPAKDVCCHEYGAPYKPEESHAFRGRADICEIGKQFDFCGNQLKCRDEENRRCFDTLPCRKSRFGVWCDAHCGYCAYPPGGGGELITNVSTIIKNIHFADFIADAHPETVTYRILSQSNPNITDCKVVGALCRGQGLISNLSIECTTPETLGSTTLNIELIGECYPNPSVAKFKITVINATTNETTSQLGFIGSNVIGDNFPLTTGTGQNLNSQEGYTISASAECSDTFPRIVINSGGAGNGINLYRCEGTGCAPGGNHIYSGSGNMRITDKNVATGTEYGYQAKDIKTNNPSNTIYIMSSSCVQSGNGTIQINATLNGNSWKGPIVVDYRYPGGMSQNTIVPAGVSATVAAGTYTITYRSGGSVGAVFQNINGIGPTVTQTLTEGGKITFAFNFVATTPQATDPQYLLFQIFTYGPQSDANGNTQKFDKSAVGKYLDDIISAVGNSRGDGASRILGFSVGPLSLDHTDQELRDTIKGSFDLALEKNMAVAVHIDDSMFWIRRKDLWSNANNVEWSDWNKTVNPHRFIGWIPITLAPQMCYNSPVIKTEITRIAKDVIGDEIEKGIARLKAAGKENLFAGVIAGWETGLPDNRMASDNADFKRLGIPPTRLGYCALTNLGYSASNQPANFDSALEGVVHDFVNLWTSDLHDAGIPTNRIYSHVSWATVSPDSLQALQKQYGADTSAMTLTHTNVDTPFNSNSRPGFSIYTSELSVITPALTKHGNPHWAMAEGVKTDTGLTWETYLGGMFNAGASLVNIFAWQAPISDTFGKETHSADAIAAYKKFLSRGVLT